MIYIFIKANCSRVIICKVKYPPRKGAVSGTKLLGPNPMDSIII